MLVFFLYKGLNFQNDKTYREQPAEKSIYLAKHRLNCFKQDSLTYTRQCFSVKHLFIRRRSFHASPALALRGCPATRHLRRSVVVQIVALGLLFGSRLEGFISVPLLDLLHLLGVAAERSAEFAPGFEGDRDRVSVAGLDLAHTQKHAVLVGAHVKEEPLGVHRYRRALR